MIRTNIFKFVMMKMFIEGEKIDWIFLVLFTTSGRAEALKLFNFNFWSAISLLLVNEFFIKTLNVLNELSVMKLIFLRLFTVLRKLFF